MIVNKVREKMARGEKVAGVFSALESTVAIECLGLMGLDFVIIDTEHGTLDPADMVPLIIAAERRDIVPFVRPKDASRESILRALDAGAMGLVIPFIKTVDEVKSIIECGKFAPLGQRGFGGGRKSGFATFPESKDIHDYFATCNRETLLFPQCETVECLNNIEEIVALDGVDGIFVGPMDLSISLGIAAQWDNPIFTEAVAKVGKVCKAAGKFAWTIGGTGEAAKMHFANGYDGVASGDYSLLIQAAANYKKEILG